MGATLGIDGNAAGAIKAVADLGAALDKVEKQTDKNAAASKRWEVEAKKIAAQIDPAAKYQQQLERLAQAVDKGSLSMDHARTAAERYRAVLDNVDKAGESAFGSDMIGKVAGMAAGYFSLQSAVGFVTGAISEMENRAKSAADAVLDSLGAVGEAQQLGPEAFGRITGTANRLRGDGVITDASLAIETGTAIENSGMTPSDTQDFLEKIALRRLVKPADLPGAATALKKFQQAFGEQEAGSISEVIDKFKAVSTLEGVSSGFNQTVIETLKSASFLAKFSTDEDAIAAFAGIEGVSPSPAAAAESLKSFGAQIAKRGLGKDSLKATLDNVGALTAGGKTTFEVLGEQNAVVGYDLLKQRQDVIADFSRRISAAVGTNTVNPLMDDPKYAAAHVRAAEEGALDLSIEERESTRQSLVAAARAAYSRAGRRRGFGSLRQMALETALAFDDWRGGDDTILRMSAREAESDPKFFSSPETLPQILKYLQDIDSSELLPQILKNLQDIDKKLGDANEQRKAVVDNTSGTNKSVAELGGKAAAKITTRQD